MKTTDASLGSDVRADRSGRLCLPQGVRDAADGRALFQLLLELLEMHVVHNQLPAADLVAAVNAALPEFLRELRWPNCGWLDPMLSLIKKLLALGDHIVLKADDGGDGPSHLLRSWLELLPRSGGPPPGMTRASYLCTA